MRPAGTKLTAAPESSCGERKNKKLASRAISTTGEECGKLKISMKSQKECIARPPGRSSVWFISGKMPGGSPKLVWENPIKKKGVVGGNLEE